MLQFSQIKKTFSHVEVLHGISFTIGPGKIIGLVGENGAGKSTLMNILGGVIPDYQGEMFLNGEKIRFTDPGQAEKIGIAMIHQELSLALDLNIAENIFLGREPVSRMGFLQHSIMHRQSREIMNQFDFSHSPATLVRNLSVGWRQMVEIARSLSRNADIIIMDEPTSALSENEISILFKKMKLLKRQGKTVIFISHRLDEIFQIVDEVVVLRDGYFMGRYPIHEVDQVKLLHLMTGREWSDSHSAARTPVGRISLSLDHLSLTRKNRKILDAIHFDLKEGEILGIAGLLGSGRSELLRYLFGMLPGRTSGTLTVQGRPYTPESPAKSIRSGVAYLPEDRKREGLLSDLTVLVNTTISTLPRMSRRGFLHTRLEEETVRRKLLDMNVRYRSLKQKITTLSGGNQQKVILSRVLMMEPQLLLLDEPTRGIDMGAKQEIYALIRNLQRHGVSMLMVSSEIPELLMLCDRILVLALGRQVAVLEAQKTSFKEILHHAFTPFIRKQSNATN